MEKVKDFVAIDFEWQSADHDPCAVGMAKVMDGVIVNKFYSLINPKEPVWSEHCCKRHGITAEMCKDAPALVELEPMIEFLANGMLLVGHNFDEAEKCVISKHFRNGSPLKEAPFFDTMKGDGRKLPERCAEYNIPLEVHHDALEDATATALLFMKLQGEEIIKPQPKEKTKMTQVQIKAFKDKEKVSPEVYEDFDIEKAEFKNNPYFGKRFYLSGELNMFRSKDEMIIMMKQKLGMIPVKNFTKKDADMIIGGGKTGVSASRLPNAQKWGKIVCLESDIYDRLVELGVEVPAMD